MHNLTTPVSTSRYSPLKRLTCAGLLAAGLLSLTLAPSAARAEGQYYGTVESYGDGVLVVKTTKHSMGHWKVVPATQVSGSIKPFDWVFVDLGGSGHIKELRFEERPTPHAGVIKEIKGKVLFVRSGNSVEEWNLAPTTLLSGVSESDLGVGDSIGVKLYKNHNLAQIRVVKKSAK